MGVVETSNINIDRMCASITSTSATLQVLNLPPCVHDSKGRTMLRTCPCAKDSVNLVSPPLGLCSSMELTSTQEGSLTNQDRSQT